MSDNGTRYVCIARPSSGREREQEKEKRNEANEETKKDIDQPDGLKCVSSIVLKTCPLSFSSSSALLFIKHQRQRPHSSAKRKAKEERERVK